VAPTREPVSAPVVEPVPAPAAPVPASGTIVAIVTGILALAGVALALRRRTPSQPAA